MLIVTATPDVPGSPVLDTVVVEPGAKLHWAETFTGTKAVTVHASGDGRVIVTVGDMPETQTPPTAAQQ